MLAKFLSAEKKLSHADRLYVGLREAARLFSLQPIFNQEAGEPFPSFGILPTLLQSWELSPSAFTGVGAVSAEYTRKGLHYWWTSEKRQERNSPKPLSQGVR